MSAARLYASERAVHARASARIVERYGPTGLAEADRAVLLEHARELAGGTDVALAARCGVHPKTVGHWRRAPDGLSSMAASRLRMLARMVLEHEHAEELAERLDAERAARARVEERLEEARREVAILADRVRALEGAAADA